MLWDYKRSTIPTQLKFIDVTQQNSNVNRRRVIKKETLLNKYYIQMHHSSFTNDIQLQMAFMTIRRTVIDWNRKMQLVLRDK